MAKILIVGNQLNLTIGTNNLTISLKPKKDDLYQFADPTDIKICGRTVLFAGIDKDGKPYLTVRPIIFKSIPFLRVIIDGDTPYLDAKIQDITYILECEYYESLSNDRQAAYLLTDKKYSLQIHYDLQTGKYEFYLFKPDEGSESTHINFDVLNVEVIVFEEDRVIMLFENIYEENLMD